MAAALGKKVATAAAVTVRAWSFLGGGLGCDAELTAEARSSDDYSGGELCTWVRTVSGIAESN
jgi:hypothetical protein